MVGEVKNVIDLQLLKITFFHNETEQTVVPSFVERGKRT